MKLITIRTGYNNLNSNPSIVVTSAKCAISGFKIITAAEYLETVLLHITDFSNPDIGYLTIEPKT